MIENHIILMLKYLNKVINHDYCFKKTKKSSSE